MHSIDISWNFVGFFFEFFFFKSYKMWNQKYNNKAIIPADDRYDRR